MSGAWVGLASSGGGRYRLRRHWDLGRERLELSHRTPRRAPTQSGQSEPSVFLPANRQPATTANRHPYVHPFPRTGSPCAAATTRSTAACCPAA